MIGELHQKPNHIVGCTCESNSFNEKEMANILFTQARTKDIQPGLWRQDMMESNDAKLWTVAEEDTFTEVEWCCMAIPESPCRSVSRITTLFDLERTAVALHQAEDWKNLEFKIHLHQKPGGSGQFNHLDLTLPQLQRVVQEMEKLSRMTKGLFLFAPCTKHPVWHRSILNQDSIPLSKSLARDLRLCLYRVCMIHTEPINDFLLNIEEFSYGNVVRRVVLRMKEEEYLKLEDLSILLTRLYSPSKGWVVNKSKLHFALEGCEDLVNMYRIQVENLPVMPTGKKRFLLHHSKYLNNSMHCYKFKPDYIPASSKEHFWFMNKVQDEMDDMRRRCEERTTREAMKLLSEQPVWNEDDPFTEYLSEPASKRTKKDIKGLCVSQYVNSSIHCDRLKPGCEDYKDNSYHQEFSAQVEVHRARVRRRAEERATWEASRALTNMANWVEED